MPGNVRIRPDRFMKEAGEGRMIFFDPISQGLSVVQDTPPGDALVISYTPSVVSDSTAAAAQLAKAATDAVTEPAGQTRALFGLIEKMRRE